MTKRRSFIKKSVLGTAGIAIGGAGFSSRSFDSVIGANERINISVIGVGGRGSAHLSAYCGMKDSHNVRILNICDVDEMFWPTAVKTVQERSGFTPSAEWDMRRVFANKDIHAVSFATPNFWHALGTIWACQAGKHVYVEKPVSYNIFEGRKMVEAGIKYKVHIQHGSAVAAGEAMDCLHSGGIGDVYMARGLCLKPRESFGIAPDAEPPASLHYDMWLGPAPWRPYNAKRTHYNWHWFWDTGNGDTGNQGPHQLHAARVGLKKDEHPVWICSFGDIYGIDRNECAQETPNTQTSLFKYADGKMLVFDTRGRYTNAEGSNNTSIGNLFYGTEGYMEYSGGWKAFRKWEKEPFAGAKLKEKAAQQDPKDLRGSIGSSFANFIEVIRSGRDQDLINPILGGHYSASLAHLANISYRLGGRELHFDGTKERFINDRDANALLTRPEGYRKPYIVPDKL